jgi:hypothetical protein
MGVALGAGVEALPAAPTGLGVSVGASVAGEDTSACGKVVSVAAGKAAPWQADRIKSMMRAMMSFRAETLKVSCANTGFTLPEIWVNETNSFPRKPLGSGGTAYRAR